jgi:hypothetical protein
MINCDACGVKIYPIKDDRELGYVKCWNCNKIIALREKDAKSEDSTATKDTDAES